MARTGVIRLTLYYERGRAALKSSAGATVAERWGVGKRVRDVAEGPDGALWLLEDANVGALIRVTPK